jgi:hypothetical protein
MSKTGTCVLLFAMAIAPAAIATPDTDLEGVYVEARSAQVYIGGCIWNSEAVTVGREAVMAWRIDRGRVDGIDVTGLSVVAAIAGDANLALRPDAARRTVLYVDESATEPQREALAGLYAGRNAAMFGELVEVVAAPISFEATAHGYRVRAGTDIALEAEDLHIDHSTVERCGEAQWYEPFVALQDATLGLTIEHSYQGAALNARWSDPNSQSSFFGRFFF